MTLRDTVLNALQEEVGQSRDQLVADLGLEERQVSNSLHLLKLDGLAKCTPEGWVRAQQEANRAAVESAGVELQEAMAAPAPRRVKKARVAKQAPRETAPKRKRGRPPKLQPPAAKVQRKAAAPAVADLSVALTDNLEVAVRRGDAQGVFTARQALRLHDFLTAVRPVLERAA